MVQLIKRVSKRILLPRFHTHNDYLARLVKHKNGERIDQGDGQFHQSQHGNEAD